MVSTNLINNTDSYDISRIGIILFVGKSVNFKKICLPTCLGSIIVHFHLSSYKDAFGISEMVKFEIKGLVKNDIHHINKHFSVHSTFILLHNSH